MYVCMFLLSTKGPGSRDTPVAVSTSSAQTLVSNVIPPLRGTGCPGKGVASLECLVTAAKCGNAPKNDAGLPQDICASLKGLPVATHWAI